MSLKRILFVCRGNTCRSPMAEGMFRHLVAQAGQSERFFIDSAGTHPGFENRAPDPRARATIAARGVDISNHATRAVVLDDLTRFDLVLAADRHVLATLAERAGQAKPSHVHLLMTYAPHMGVDEIPDPWHGTMADYEHALDLIAEAVHGLVDDLKLTSGGVV